MMRVLVVLVVLFPGPGCSSQGEIRKPTLQVQCTVRFEDGTVPSDAVIVFHPLDETGYTPFRPRGRVQADGTAPLSTYLNNDGIPSGDYTVTVVWPAPSESKDRERAGEEIDQLDNRYSQPQTSPLKRTVKSGDRAIEPVVLSR